MEVIFHMGKDSNQNLREFAEKRADFAVRELRDCGADKLKALPFIIHYKVYPAQVQALKCALIY